jgi:hypothetical protein
MSAFRSVPGLNTGSPASFPISRHRALAVLFLCGVVPCAFLALVPRDLVAFVVACQPACLAGLAYIRSMQADIFQPALLASGRRSCQTLGDLCLSPCATC